MEVFFVASLSQLSRLNWVPIFSLSACESCHTFSEINSQKAESRFLHLRSYSACGALDRSGFAIYGSSKRLPYIRPCLPCEFTPQSRLCGDPIIGEMSIED